MLHISPNYAPSGFLLITIIIIIKISTEDAIK